MVDRSFTERIFIGWTFAILIAWLKALLIANTKW